ncbi:MAG: hypothetical protein ACW99A_08895 [Candidatus Kariarchaeaceae archaeon]
MNIEREVTDLLQVSISVFILSLILVSENSEFNENQLLLSGLVFLILFTFVHIILVQLNGITIDQSRIFAYVAIIPLLTIIIGLLSYDRENPNGFWDGIGLSYSTILVISLLGLIAASILSIFSKRAKI